MDSNNPSQNGKIVNSNMPPESGCIGQNDVVADGTVMCDMGVGHEEIAAANAGYPASPLSAPIDRNTLAKDVVVSNHQLGFFSAIAQILGWITNGRKRKNLIPLAHRGPAVNYGVRADDAPCANGNPRPNDGKRLYFHILSQLGLSDTTAVG